VKLHWILVRSFALIALIRRRSFRDLKGRFQMMARASLAERPSTAASSHSEAWLIETRRTGGAFLATAGWRAGEGVLIHVFGFVGGLAPWRQAHFGHDLPTDVPGRGWGGRASPELECPCSLIRAGIYNCKPGLQMQLVAVEALAMGQREPGQGDRSAVSRRLFENRVVYKFGKQNNGWTFAPSWRFWIIPQPHVSASTKRTVLIQN